MAPIIDITFLHTAPVHVATFDALVQAAAPGLRVHHVVNEAVLADAQRLGSTHPQVRQGVQQAMAAAAADSGAPLVVCTCSTIGTLAEATPTDGRFEVARIDRAMADRAVALGPRVLMVAAVASTLAPTRELLLDAASRAGCRIDLDELLVDTAWPLFLQGDQPAYLAAVAEATRARAAHADVVVLAQASMAGAARALADLGVEVLSSPLPGVARAIERVRQLRNG